MIEEFADLIENIFAKIFRFIGLIKHPDSDEWVDTKGKVPRWVKVEIAQIRKRYGGTNSSLANKYWTIHGKHYKYRFEFVGQGGATAVIHKKRA
jgi:hypothetical protein